jgi:hypothetical protein
MLDSGFPHIAITAATIPTTAMIAIRKQGRTDWTGFALATGGR